MGFKASAEVTKYIGGNVIGGSVGAIDHDFYTG